MDAAVAARCASDLPYSLCSLLLPCTTNGVVVLCARCRTCFGIVFSYAMTGGDFSLSTEPTKTTGSCVPTTRTCVCACGREGKNAKLTIKIIYLNNTRAGGRNRVKCRLECSPSRARFYKVRWVGDRAAVIVVAAACTQRNGPNLRYTRYVCYANAIIFYAPS